MADGKAKLVVGLLLRTGGLTAKAADVPNTDRFGDPLWWGVFSQ